MSSQLPLSRSLGNKAARTLTCSLLRQGKFASDLPQRAAGPALGPGIGPFTSCTWMRAGICSSWSERVTLLVPKFTWCPSPSAVGIFPFILFPFVLLRDHFSFISRWWRSRREARGQGGRPLCGRLGGAVAERVAALSGCT